MLVYLRVRSAQTIVHAATLRQKLQINFPTQSQYTDTKLPSPSTDPIIPGAWQGIIIIIIIMMNTDPLSKKP